MRSGHDVVALDNLVTGDERNVAALRSTSQFELRLSDVTRACEIEGAIDVVAHLASLASPVAYGKRPIETLAVGTIGTVNALEMARAKGATFFFASTSEVYGNPLEHPQKETYTGNVDPVAERSCYDESKRCGEAFVMAFHRVYGMSTRIVRIFNTYGPRMRVDDGRVIPAFIAAALRNQPLLLHGGGSQTRSLCYVDDLLEGFRAVIERGNSMPYNLGNPDEITIRELAERIIWIARSTSRMEEVEPRPNDPRRRRPDIGRAVEELGWTPRVQLADGLRRTIDHYRRM